MAGNIKKNAIIAGAAAASVLGAAAIGAAAVVASGAVKQIARTKAGRARISEISDEAGNRVRVLVQGGVYQSATYTNEQRFEPVFNYYRAFGRIFDAESDMAKQFGHGVDDVLVLGGGGFSFPKWALTQHPRLRMDVVEYDPAVIKLARRWFYVEELERRAAGRLRIIRADARSFLSLTAVGSRRYDAVVSDCFCGSEHVRKLFTVEAFAVAKKCLNPGGIFVANIVHREGESVDFLRDAIASASELFPHVQVLDASDPKFSDSDNYLLVASEGDYFMEGALGFGEEMVGTAQHDEQPE